MARDDLPAVVVSVVVARQEDPSADRARSALERSPEPPEGTNQQFVCGVTASLHLPADRSCLGWVHEVTTWYVPLSTSVTWYQ